VSPVKWATSAWVKVERAKENIRDLKARTQAFFVESPPYSIVREYDTQTGELIFRWERRPEAVPIPAIWGAIAGDAINNLRSSLDVLWRQVTDPRPGKRNNQRKNPFPFEGSANKLEARMRGEKQPARKAALKIALAFQSYKSENNPLWDLGEASNSDKHEVPTVVIIGGASTAAFTVEDTMRRHHVVHLVTSRELMPVEDGKELYRAVAPLPQHPDKQMKPTFGIAFGECEPLQGRPVFPTLHEFAGIVQGIFETFRRAGLIN
jgi:hypothetical protein